MSKGKKFKDYSLVSEVNDSDEILVHDAQGIKKASIDQIKKKTIQEANEIVKKLNVFIDNAAMHNCIVRCKNLGTTVTDTQFKAIKDGTFDDMWLGDYWVIGGHNWRIVEFDPFWKMGDQGGGFVTHGVAIMPDDCLLKADGSTTKYMKDSDATTGGYNGTKYIATYRAQCLNTINGLFGASHIGKHRELFSNATSNGKANGLAWYDATVELPSEAQIYGTNVWCDGSYNVGVNHHQFPLFVLSSTYITNRENYWLRDVYSAAAFCIVYGSGRADSCSASAAWIGVRPYFILIG